MNHAEAIEDMMLFTVAVMALMPEDTTVYYPDKKIPEDKGNDTWITIKNTFSHSETTSFGEDGKNGYLNLGMLVFQIFTPAGEGLQTRHDIVTIVKTNYENKRSNGGMIFRGADVTDGGDSGKWFQTNIVIHYEYSEYK